MRFAHGLRILKGKIVFQNSLRNWIERRFHQSLTRTHHRRSRSHQQVPSCESLETRQLLTAVSPLGDEFPATTINETGGNFAPIESGYDVVYNAQDNQSLLVYLAADPDFTETDDREREIYGQFIGPNGETGDNFRISDIRGIGTVTAGEIYNPRVAWDSRDNQYLVTWMASDTDSPGIVDGEFEIFGQFLDATGQEIGRNDFRISEVDGLGTTNNYIGTPAIAYNVATDQYLVSWYGQPNPGPREIFATLVDNDGPIDGTKVQLTQFNDPNDSEREWFPSVEDVAVNEKTGEYMVALTSSFEQGGTDSPREVYTVPVSGEGVVGNLTQVSPDDSISETDPSMVYDSHNDQFFLAWRKAESQKRNVVGQFLDANGEAKRSQVIPISQANESVDRSASIYRPRVTWNSAANEYLVTWVSADQDHPGLTSDDHEVFGQRIAFDGSEIGEDDFRISDSLKSNLKHGDVIWNARENEYLVTWLDYALGEGQFKSRRYRVLESHDVDIRSHFNVDIVANETVDGIDREQDQVGDSGYVFLTDSLAKSLDPDGNGLPDDGRFHPVGNGPAIQLGYAESGAGNNAVRLDDQSEFTVDLEGRIFDSVSVVGLAPEGSSTLEITARFASGGEADSDITPEWNWVLEYEDTADRQTLVNDLDWVRPNATGFQDINDLALFVYRFPLTETLIDSLTIKGTGDPQYILGVTGTGFAPGNIVVTNPVDENDGDWSPGDLSLREALHMTGWHEDVSETVLFDESLYDQTLSIDRGLITTAGAFSLHGPGADRLTIDAGQSPLFRFENSSLPEIPRVELEGLTLTNASYTSTIIATGGAAIGTRDVDLELNGVAIRNSTANQGGAIRTAGDGSLVVRNSEFAGNMATTDGNAAQGEPNGGAIYATGRTRIENSTFSNNRADGEGGAIYVREDLAMIVNSTITLNHANNANRANSFQRNLGMGGAVATDAVGGAEYFNTILVDNFNGSDGQEILDDVAGTIEPLSANNAIGTVRGAGVDFDPNLGNLRGGLNDPLIVGLEPLADNGGPTRTHALRPNSVAVDAGNNNFANVDTDQRLGGHMRLFNNVIDIGAFELQPEPLTVTFSDAEATEGGFLEFTATLNRPVAAGEEFPLFYGVTDITSNAPDYILPPGGIEFAEGEQSKTFRVEVVDDDTVERTEFLRIDWLTSTFPVSFVNPSVTGTIIDNDRAVLSIDDITVNETDGTATFVVSLPTPIDIEFNVDVQYSDGAATGSVGGANADYDNAPDVVAFAVGETGSKSVTVTITDDDLEEGPHEFFAGLSTPFSIGDRAIDLTDSATATIIDDDDPVGLTFDIDGDGNVQALTDGILALRYLAGFSGSTLTEGAIAANATRTNPNDIASHLSAMGDALDLDGNSERLALSDGVLMLRVFAGFSGPSLIEGAVSPNATRTTSEQIAQHVEQYLPPVASPSAMVYSALDDDELDGLFSNSEPQWW